MPVGGIMPARSFRVGRGRVQHFEQHILRVVRRPDLRLTVLVPVA